MARGHSKAISFDRVFNQVDVAYELNGVGLAQTPLGFITIPVLQDVLIYLDGTYQTSTLPITSDNSQTRKGAQPPE